MYTFIMFRLNEDELNTLNERLRHYFTDSEVLKMKEYVQHGSVSTYEHSYRVAVCCLYIKNRLHIDCSEKDLLEAAFLHDFYLYDWHIDDPSHRLHGFTHPAVAGKNAFERFNISPLARDAILSHMWPLTITKIPNSIEGLILVISDKICSTEETLFIR